MWMEYALAIDRQNALLAEASAARRRAEGRAARRTRRARVARHREPAAETRGVADWLRSRGAAHAPAEVRCARAAAHGGCPA